MLYIGGRYSAVSVSDRGLILDMYGVNSFQEDICKKMSQLTANSTGVCLLCLSLIELYSLKKISVGIFIFNYGMKQRLLSQKTYSKIQQN